MRKFIVPFLFIFLFAIPFFWFTPGQMDIGGDTSRLYFFDPLHYLQIQALYGIVSSGIGGESVSYWGIPYFVLLVLVKNIVQSPTILIAISHGFSLSVAFITSYLLIKDILAKSEFNKSKYVELPAILCGIFYIFTPTLILGWDKEILTHNQFFLNPLMFFLLFRFITRNDIFYLFTALIVTFLFSPNFSFVGAPDFFSFYPISIIFILFYTKLVLKRGIPMKSILIGLVLFLILQSFHLGPQISGLFTGGSQINKDVFSEQAKYSRGLGYFTGVAPYVKVSISWLNLAQLNDLKPFDFAFIIFPVFLLLGFFWNKTKQYLLTAVFFLITFFFVTANITDLGFNFYVKLFNIPGFSMFRNYFGQWVFVYTFFYMLLFGQALIAFFQSVKLRYVTIISIYIVLLLTYNALPFIDGNLLNKTLYQSKIKVVSQMDPEYERVLSYIRNLRIDGKFISFPLADAGYQIISGLHGGAYQGPSTISYLTGKNDFTGYDGLLPFSDTFLTLVKNNDIIGINRLFSILNIKYVFYNSDPKIYDNYFPQYPYTVVRGTMPNNQKGYQALLAKLPIHKIKDFGSYYHIYEVDNYLPHFYTATDYIYATDVLTPFFVKDLHDSLRSVVYTQDEKILSSADVILTASNTNPLLDLENNYHLHTSDPYVSKEMDDIIYPFIVWNEKRSLKKLQYSPDDYIDYSLLYITKRISELDKFPLTPITHKTFQEPKLWQFYKWNEFNSWESNLIRIGTQADTLITWLNTASLSENTRNIDRIKVHEGLNGLQFRLTNIITNSIHSDSDKAYLKKKVKDLFTRLYQKVNLQTVDTASIPYQIDMPKQLTGEYTPYLHSETGVNLDSSLYTLQVGDQSTTPVSTKKPSSIIAFNPIDITDPNVHLKLLYKPKNVIGSGQWIGVGSVNESDSQIVFTIDNRLSIGEGFSKKIAEYQPNTQYVITFDYYNEGSDLLFALYEKQKINNNLVSKTYFNNILSSHSWKTQQSLVTSSPNATVGYIQFVTPDTVSSGKLHIRNLTMVKVPNDTLLFKKITKRKATQNIPTISFKKINPTRYIVHVSNATDPYTLVFSESFNNNWKLYMPVTTPTQNSIIASYFGGQVQEEESDNVFFNTTFLSNGTLVHPESHTIGNGYANVWNISPANVGNKKDYYLEVVYQPQVDFYYYLAVSVVTFSVVVLVTGVFFIRKNEEK